MQYMVIMLGSNAHTHILGSATFGKLTESRNLTTCPRARLPHLGVEPGLPAASATAWNLTCSDFQDVPRPAITSFFRELKVQRSRGAPSSLASHSSPELPVVFFYFFRSCSVQTGIGRHLSWKTLSSLDPNTPRLNTSAPF